PVPFDETDRTAVLVLLQRADAALAAGNLHEPAGASAIDLYTSVLAAAPENSRAKTGRERVLDSIGQRIEAALAAGDYPAAAQDFPVLQALRADMPATIRIEERLTQAEPLRLALQRARRALERNRLDQGPRNALQYLEQVRAEEADNQTALELRLRLQRRLIEMALGQGQDGDFAQANALVARARAVAPDQLQVLTEATSVLAGQRGEAAAARLSQAHQHLDAGAADAAEAVLEQALAISAEAVGAGLVRERIRNLRLYGGYGEGERFRDALASGDSGPRMVVIPVGSFLMGSPDRESGRRSNEGPQFRVRFDHGFALAETEITVAQYRRFVEATNHRSHAERQRRSTIYDERSGSMREVRGINWRHNEAGDPAGDDNPVVHLAWADAAAYAAWLAQETGQPYRLPSEAEFEYALRAGSSSRYPWGDGAPPRPLANVSSQGDASPSNRTWTNAFPGDSDGWFGIAPVGSFPRNEFGLHDLAGNVSEWVEDCWHSSYLRAPSDGSAWVNPGCGRRVVRGASWASGPEQVRSAYRLNVAADTTNPRIGFRVARGL
ncbi:MAG: formylglycine-generating enzyme family protein, partial [Lysobacterales bacterium]